MTTINEKLGLKPAGRRAMMRLPAQRAAAADLTATQCPQCGRRGVRQVKARAQLVRLCAVCGHTWAIE